MSPRFSLALSVLSALLLAAPALAAPTPIWTVPLTPGVPRHLSFPVPIRVGMAADLPVRAEVMGEHLWLTGHANSNQLGNLFGAGPARLLVRAKSGEQQWILNLVAADTPHPVVESLHLPKALQPERELHQRYVQLARWGWQQLYSPERLLRPLPGTRRTAVARAAVLLIRCRAEVQPPCPHIVASPLAAWRQARAGGNLHLTAVELRNRSPQPVPLAAGWLRGRWLATSFSVAELPEGGSAVALLLSDAPFHTSLRAL